MMVKDLIESREAINPLYLKKTLSISITEASIMDER